MTIRDMYESGMLSATDAVVACLMDNGWDRGEAAAHLQSLVNADRPRPWKAYTDEEREIARSAIPDGTTGYIPITVIREVAARLGRSEKSVRSLMERLIADPEVGSRPRGRPRKT